mgnify:CR=1 FL=1
MFLQPSEVKRTAVFYELRYKYFGGEFILPSQSVLEQKKAIVAELSERLKSSITGVVVSYEGINTEDDTKLRKELRENDVKYTVVKNTLLSRACEEAGLDDIKPVLEGTTAIATSDSEDTIVALSKLPTREVLLANVLGAFQAPIASFARAVQAIVDKGGVEACAAEAAEEAPAEAEAPAAE